MSPMSRLSRQRRFWSTLCKVGGCTDRRMVIHGASTGLVDTVVKRFGEVSRTESCYVTLPLSTRPCCAFVREEPASTHTSHHSHRYVRCEMLLPYLYGLLFCICINFSFKLQPLPPLVHASCWCLHSCLPVVLGARRRRFFH